MLVVTLPGDPFYTSLQASKPSTDADVKSLSQIVCTRISRLSTDVITTQRSSVPGRSLDHLVMCSPPDDLRVPRISFFDGIAIYMYWDEGEHAVAHFHAIHGDERASVALDGQLLAGRLDARSLRLVGEWAQLHQDELLANWERARRNEALLPVAPLE